MGGPTRLGKIIHETGGTRDWARVIGTFNVPPEELGKDTLVDLYVVPREVGFLDVDKVARAVPKLVPFGQVRHEDAAHLLNERHIRIVNLRLMQIDVPAGGDWSHDNHGGAFAWAPEHWAKEDAELAAQWQASLT